MTNSDWERDWPVVPIPLFLFRDLVYELAREEWNRVAAMPPFEVRDLGLLKSTLALPYQRHAGHELYPGVVAKAACLFRGLVKNHPLIDGNKRAAVTGLGTFLLINGRPLTANNDQVRNYALRVARRKGDYPLALITRWVRTHSEPFLPAQLADRRKANLVYYAAGDPIETWFAEDL